MNVHALVHAHIISALEALQSEGALPRELDFANVEVSPPRDAAHGDLASNAALVLAKAAKMKPRDIAEKLAGKLRDLPDVESVEVAGAGSEHPLVDYDARRTPASLLEHARLAKLFSADLWKAGYPNAWQRIGLAGTIGENRNVLDGAPIDGDRKLQGNDGKHCARLTRRRRARPRHARRFGPKLRRRRRCARPGCAAGVRIRRRRRSR